MIFSRRKPVQAEAALHILIREAASDVLRFSPVAAPVLDDWRSRTDTNGAMRRERQIKQDNELL